MLAPTGTISFLMDCDTTGIEPDLGLVKMKKLVGGGTMQIVNQGVTGALGNLGYDAEAAAAIVGHIAETGSVIGAPGSGRRTCRCVCLFHGRQRHRAVGPHRHDGGRAAFSLRSDQQDGQPSRGDDRRRSRAGVHRRMEARSQGCCAVSRQLQGCAAADRQERRERRPRKCVRRLWPNGAQPIRKKLPRSRRSRTFEFRVADCKGFATVGEYDDGRPGEVFIRVSKQGSTLAGIMDAFAISVSHGLQYGVPLTAFVDAFVGMRFEPAGMTDDTELRIASSLMDYLFRRLALEYLTEDERRQRNILTTGERSQPTLPGVAEAATTTSQGLDVPPDPPNAVQPADRSVRNVDAPFCGQCGTQMVRAGSCFACRDCGSTSGCS